ncbi:G-protein alpha subunit-domain-containing protein [Xylariaceae sp. FL1272]|nr:G-protein alpha subunit-domain-containing protein [Xylariaceae sp. FL1272]
MDPLTILQVVGTVVALGDAVLRCITQLSSLKAQFHDAPIIVTSMIGQLHIIKAAQDQLSLIVAPRCSNNEARHLQLANQISSALDSFSPVIMALESQLCSYEAARDSKMTIISRIGFLKDDTNMTNLSMLLDRQVNALNLLLQALQCRTWAQQNNFIAREESQSILRLAEDCSSSLVGLEDTGSIMTESTENTMIRFEFDDVLRKTLLYRVAERAHSRFAIRNRKFRRSGISLGSNYSRLSGALSSKQITPSISRSILVDDSSSQISSTTSTAQITRQPTKSLRSSTNKPAKQNAKDLKVLLLGTSESGKTTLLKAMQECTTVKQKIDDSWQAREILWTNVLSSIRTVLEAMEKLSIIPANVHQFKNAKELIYSCGEYPSMCHLATADIQKDAQILHELWSDEGFRIAIRRSREYNFHDNTIYYITHVREIAEPLTTSLTPRWTDMLRTRIRTTGIHQYHIHYKDYGFRIHDVGGERSERKKWNHVNEGQPAVVLTIDVTAYGRMLTEDENCDRMNEQFALFRNVVDSYFKSHLIVLFTKVDLLEGHIERNDINASHALTEIIPKSWFPIQNSRQYIEALKNSCRNLMWDPERRERVQFICADLVNIKEHNAAADILDLVRTLDKQDSNNRDGLFETLPLIAEEIDDAVSHIAFK